MHYTYIAVVIILQFVMVNLSYAQPVNTLPKVLGISETLDRTTCWIMDNVRHMAVDRSFHSYQKDIPTWIRQNLHIDAAAIGDLDMQIVRTIDRDNFMVHHILFQSQQGVYVPANLYVPKGNGPFPAVINSHGHWPGAKWGQIVQQTAQLLARNGYVCLNMDAWGAGERGSGNEHEYHGASLGSSLLDAGIPLMGMQLIDNQRAIDVLQSLPYVDAERIGATGASGGGNQTWWLTALDERIKAAVPVVSVGTFASYIMNSNCVCELHPNGLVDMENADVLASVAPRPVKILTALRDGNAAFNVYEMLKTYDKAKKSYENADCHDNLTYELFDEKHDYTQAMQLRMLDWFDRHFRNGRTNSIDTAFYPLEEAELTVGVSQKLKTKITTTVAYVGIRAKQMQEVFAQSESINREVKVGELRGLLGYKALAIRKVEKIPAQADYERLLLTTTDQRLIPLLVKQPVSDSHGLHVVFPSGGISSIPTDRIAEWTRNGEGVVFVDLLGLGERSSRQGDEIDGRLPRFHTLSRSLLWMGESMMAIWTSEIGLVMEYVQERFPHREIHIVADRETTIASLLYSVLHSFTGHLSLYHLPLTYVPDGQKNHNEQGLNMAIHIPGIIPWGDIAGLIGFSPADIVVERPIGMSGKEIDTSNVSVYARQIEQIRLKSGNTGDKIHFNR